MPDLELREYLDLAGRSPFGRWFARLDAAAAARVTSALYRMAQGNLSHVKGVGGGLLELRIDFGPGYRVYFGRPRFDGGDPPRRGLEVEAGRGHRAREVALGGVSAEGRVSGREERGAGRGERKRWR